MSKLSGNAINLLNNLLVKDPKKRLKASQALKHPWIK